MSVTTEPINVDRAPASSKGSGPGSEGPQPVEGGTGDTAVMSDNVSRVHAMFVRVDGSLHLVDAGSTNGTWSEQRAVKCEPVVDGQTYALARMLARWEPVQ